jgi:hypothetical protein
MELAMSGLFRARWSSDIHREWMHAVSEKRGIPVSQLVATRLAMDESVPDGCVTGYQDLIAALALPDPNDRHVLAAAIHCGANVIVTFNEADFPAEAIQKYGLRTRDPDAFIVDVDGTDPGALIDAARHDIAHYKNPPLTIDEYLDGLRAGGVPMTADRLAGLRVPLGS